MDLLTQSIVLFTALISVAGTIMLCGAIQRHSKVQARRDLFGLPPQDGI